MTLTQVRNQLPLHERVYEATAALVLEVGARQLRTADIARRSGTTESTLFRSVGKLDAILEATDRWAWSLIVERVARAAFANPSACARDSLLFDTSIIWSMRDDARNRVAATYAFLFFRRKQELGLSVSEEQTHFEERIGMLCRRLSESECLPPERGGADLLARLLLNYIATVWLTWEMLPSGCNDILGEHDLSADEAQLGVLVLLDRALGVEVERGNRLGLA